MTQWFPACKTLGLPNATWLTFGGRIHRGHTTRGPRQGGRPAHGSCERRHHIECLHAGVRWLAARRCRERRQRIVRDRSQTGGPGSLAGSPQQSSSRSATSSSRHATSFNSSLTTHWGNLVREAWCNTAVTERCEYFVRPPRESYQPRAKKDLKLGRPTRGASSCIGARRV